MTALQVTATDRLRSLQSLVASSEVDALLLVCGVDGRHHLGSRECLNWLLSGLCGRDICERRRTAAAAGALRVTTSKPSKGTALQQQTHCYDDWARKKIWAL